MKINIIILTYNRPTELDRCLASIENSKSFFNENLINFEIFIFDNCSNNYDITKLVNKFLPNLPIKLFISESNVGAIKNFWQSVYSQLNQVFDYLLFLSDDDEMLPSFPQSIKKNIFEPYDLVMNSSIQTNEKYSYKRKLYKKFKSQKLNFIYNARLLTGFMISKQFMIKMLSIVKKIETKTLYDFWYQMEFISLFHDKSLIIDEPAFIHTIDNVTFWGEYDHYQIMYRSRILSKKIALKMGYINSNEFDKLVIDFIARGKINYLFKGIRLIDKSYISNYFMIILFKLILLRIQRLINFFVHRIKLFNPLCFSRKI